MGGQVGPRRRKPNATYRPLAPELGHVHRFLLDIDYGVRCAGGGVAVGLQWTAVGWQPRCIECIDGACTPDEVHAPQRAPLAPDVRAVHPDVPVKEVHPVHVSREVSK